MVGARGRQAAPRGGRARSTAATRGGMALREFMLCAHRLQLFGGADSFATLSQRVVKLMVEAVPPRSNQLAKPARPPRARYYRGR